jgi:hypothetical protein
VDTTHDQKFAKTGDFLMPEKMYSETEVREMLKQLGVSQPEPPGEADKIISAVDGIFTDAEEKEVFLQHARDGARAVRDIRRRKSQFGLRKEYQERLQAIPRGSIPAITALQKEFRAKGLDV